MALARNADCHYDTARGTGATLVDREETRGWGTDCDPDTRPAGHEDTGATQGEREETWDCVKVRVSDPEPQQCPPGHTREQGAAALTLPEEHSCTQDIEFVDRETESVWSAGVHFENPNKKTLRRDKLSLRRRGQGRGDRGGVGARKVTINQDLTEIPNQPPPLTRPSDTLFNSDPFASLFDELRQDILKLMSKK